MKKTYVAPKIQTVYLRACGILSASDNGGKISMSLCLCPHIPETKCELYCEYVKRNFGWDKENFKKLKNAESKILCPNRKSCEDYRLYQNFINDKQR